MNENQNNNVPQNENSAQQPNYQQPPVQQQQPPVYQQPPVQQPVYQQPVKVKKPYQPDNVKLFSILAYIGVLWIPGLFSEQRYDPHVRFHLNQGILLTIFSVALGIVVAIISAIINAIFISVGALWSMWWFAALITGVLSFIGWAAPIALMVFGIIHAVKGKDTPMPVIGKIFKILK